MEGNILDVEADTSHVLISHNTLLSGPLEGSFSGVLNFLKILHLLGNIDEEVSTSGLRTEAPDLLGIIRIPFIVINKCSHSLSSVLLGSNLVILDSLSEFVTERRSSAEKSVMLVGRLGETNLTGFFNDSLFVGDDWVTLLDWALGVLLLEILEANLYVELTASGNNVFSRLFSCANNERIGLGELAETFNKFGEIRSILDLDGDTHDRGNRVLHDLDAVSLFVIRNGTLFHEVLINTDETDSVTAGDIGDSLDLSSHHEDGSLDVLDIEVVSGSRLVVGSHNSDLLTSLNGTGEDTTESVESSLIVGGHHLGNEDHEGTVLVTVLDGLTARILNGALVEHGGTISLSLLGGGQLHDDHLKKGLSGVDPLLEDALEEILGALVSLSGGKVDVEGLKHLPDGVKVVVHDVTAKLNDGSHDELDEAALELLAISLRLSLELSCGSIEIVVTPELLHESGAIELELLGVGSGEPCEGEGPAEESRTEGNRACGWVDLLGLSHVLELISGDDDVSVLDDTLEVLVHSLTIDLELKDTSVDLVDHHDGLDLLGEGLTEDGLSLHTDTFDVIDDDESTISDTKGSGDFRGEIDVTW